MGGLGYAVNETITMADALLGAGGAPDFTFDVISNWYLGSSSNRNR